MPLPPNISLVITNVYSFLDTLSEIFREVFYTYISIYMIFFFVIFLLRYS